MGAFYGTKIQNNESNPKTGAAWSIEDVPQLWKSKTEKWLQDNK